MLDSDLLSLRDRAIGSLLSDGRICIIKDQLVVTTLSYLSTELQKRPWLIKGNRLRTQTGLPWLVVHHYPPALYQSAGPEELSAGKLAREFEPTFWLSGRFYEEPYQKEFVWFQWINHRSPILAQSGSRRTGWRYFCALALSGRRTMPGNPYRPHPNSDDYLLRPFSSSNPAARVFFTVGTFIKWCSRVLVC